MTFFVPVFDNFSSSFAEFHFRIIVAFVVILTGWNSVLPYFFPNAAMEGFAIIPASSWVFYKFMAIMPCPSPCKSLWGRGKARQQDKDNCRFLRHSLNYSIFFLIIEFLNSAKQFVGCKTLSEVLSSTPNILTVSLWKSTEFGRFYRKLQNRNQNRKKNWISKEIK